MTKGKKFAPHKQVNVECLRDNNHLYPGVYAAIGRLGLIPFVTFNHPYNYALLGGSNGHEEIFFSYGSFSIKDGPEIRSWEDKWLGNATHQE